MSLVELQCWDVLNLVLVKNEDDADGDNGDDPNCDVDYHEEEDNLVSFLKKCPDMMVKPWFVPPPHSVDAGPVNLWLCRLVEISL